MHEITLMPYINAAIGLRPAFSANVSSALMSTSNQLPSSRRVALAA
jgi:hypothetical protein